MSKPFPGRLHILLEEEVQQRAPVLGVFNEIQRAGVACGNAYLNWNQRCQICRNSRGFAKQDYVISRSASHEKAKHHLKCLQSLNVGDERCNNCGRWHTKKSFVTFYYNMKKEYPHRWCIGCYDSRVEVLKESIREDKKTLKAIQATRE